MGTLIMNVLTVRLFVIFLHKSLVDCSIKRGNNPNININDLVDWSSIKLPGSMNADLNEDIASTDIPGEHLTPQDFHQADFVEESFDTFQEDPIEFAQLFEGDIDNVSMDDLRQMRKGESRNAIRDSWRKWPGATIPYIISSVFSQHERSVIAKAMKEYHDKTCIRFRPRTSEKAFIHIMKGNGCSSSVGRTGSQQTVSLGNGCVYTGIVMHELMHASGFWHEQSRADRDKYITIMWNNIMSGMEYNFLKYDLRKIDHLGASYDTCSVMHYGATAFAKSYGKPTIVPKQAGECKLGQRNGFSDTDIRKLNTLYECSGYPQVGSGQAITTRPVVTTKPATEAPYVKPACKDQNKYCATWARLEECQKNPSWMLVYCPVSCNQCSLTCEDNNVYCSTWAEMGECSKNPDYMNVYCAKSCKKCSSEPCSDESSDCGTWAGKGFCKAGLYVDYMKLRCKKSCKLC